ncbi:MAG: hypothetical protein HY821_05315 [Acidobacteria bacterium]|nr:hypothetical protein [Acidobacteriota bacterium]
MHRWPCRPYPHSPGRQSGVTGQSANSPGRLGADSSAGASAQAEAWAKSPVSTWATESLNFTPDPKQAQILDSPAHRLILLCTRQFGKSTLAAIKALHFALTNPNTLTLLAAPVERRAAEWIRLIHSYLRLLNIQPKSDGIHPHSVALPNGSRIVGLPGVVDNNRGYPAHLLIFEEAAIVPEEMFEVLTGSLAATDGHLWLISSAGPQIGFFYDQWHNHELPWQRFKVTARDCRRISQEFLDHQQLLIGESAFRREFLCEFTASGHQIFTRELIDSISTDEHQPWNGGRPLWPQ